MTGKLINIGQEWFIEYDKNGENKIYELSPESVLWTKKYDVNKILNENKEVEFNFFIPERPFNCFSIGLVTRFSILVGELPK